LVGRFFALFRGYLNPTNSDHNSDCKEEIIEEGLYYVVPKRKSNRANTINYLPNKKNNMNWSKARKPGKNHQIKMVSLDISFGVQQVLGNHTYKVGDTAFL
jgi:hypothetical protein